MNITGQAKRERKPKVKYYIVAQQEFSDTNYRDNSAEMLPV